MVRYARRVTRRGSSFATAIADVLFVAIVLLVVCVGVLATESRLPNPGQNPSSQHISKSSRMTECGGDELAPAQTDDSRPSPPVLTTETPSHYWLFPIELPLPEIVGVPQAHGFRSPPTV